MRPLTALFGGSFDPVHQGHLAIASRLLTHYDFRKLYFVPAQRNPLKEGTSASGPQRLEMLKLALRETNEPRFGVLDWELMRAAPSYTVTTLEQWHQRDESSGSSDPALVMGNEVFARLAHWHEPRRVIELANVIVVVRESDEPVAVSQVLAGAGVEKVAETRADHFVHSGTRWIEVRRLPVLDVSSTRLRQQLAQRSPDSPAPQGIGDSVWEYIKENRLYAVS